MLILTRKLGESIRIDEHVRVTIVEVEGKSVKIGIEAPRSVSIHREEVFLRIKDENTQAASDEKQDLGGIADLFRKKE
jgi:carbon storage regulator